MSLHFACSLAIRRTCRIHTTWSLGVLCRKIHCVNLTRFQWPIFSVLDVNVLLVSSHKKSCAPTVFNCWVMWSQFCSVVVAVWLLAVQRACADDVCNGDTCEEPTFDIPSWIELPPAPEKQIEPKTWPLERQYLEEFFAATGGLNWGYHEGWGTDLPLNEWRGVRTDEAGHVSEIRLVKHKLSGTIPNCLASLSYLKYLNLSRNRKLVGSIPSALTSLTNLEDLHLYSSGLTGTIPQEIGRLTGLTNLVLMKNKLTGVRPMEGFAKLQELTYIDIRGNQFDSIGKCVLRIFLLELLVFTMHVVSTQTVQHRSRWRFSWRANARRSI